MNVIQKKVEKELKSGASDLEAAMEAFFKSMSEIGEPNVDAPTANVPISMVSGCVLYSVLQRMGLASGNLNSIAEAVGCTGAGLKSRLAIMKALYEEGRFPGAEDLFESIIDEAKKSSEEADSEEETKE